MFQKIRATFLNNFLKHWPIFFIISAGSITKKRAMNDYNFGHFSSILLLHYLVKFRSRTLSVYNNEFKLRKACVG